ncbi:GlxA family transcriptional regulator [Pseudonocardia xinjiangensis]|uniref:GlxA family transcriptional regulator n=1 Tax=Pseudonocardia xinjiangensis TaxID=75289 RepID=UPI003D934AD9
MAPSLHRVGILVFDGVKMLDVAGPAEVFAEANRGEGNYEVTTVSVTGKPAMSSIGLPISATGSAHDARFDTVLVAGGGFPKRAVTPEHVDVATEMSRGARRTGSVCTGAFVLAEAGLLAGKRATTHWAMAAELARRYPDVSVQPDAIWIKDGSTYSSGGVAAGIDLALALLEEDHGPQLTRSVARALVVYMKRPGGQSQFSASLQGPPPRTPAIRLVAESVAADPSVEWSLAALAAVARVSARHLTRMFREELDTTPARYVERIRFDLARSHLDSGMNATQAALRAGFPSYESFRRVFVRRLGVSPARYQQRFTTTARNDAELVSAEASWLDETVPLRS